MLAGAAVPVVGVPVIPLNAMYKGVQPVVRGFALVGLGDFMGSFHLGASFVGARFEVIEGLEQF